MDSTTPVTPALLPAQGRQRDGKRQSDPPPYRPRSGRTARGNGARPPPPPSPPLSAGASTARQCPVASEMACRPWGIPRGRGVQTQAQAVVACLPCSPSQRADRQPGGTSPALGRGGRRSDGATVPPLPPCTSVGDPAVPLSASCPRARQSAIRRCYCPPLTSVHVSRRSDGAAPHPAPSPPVPAPYT